MTNKNCSNELTRQCAVCSSDSLLLALNHVGVNMQKDGIHC